MKGDEKNHESETVRSSGIRDCGSDPRWEPVVVSVLPQRGTLKDSKWREPVMFLSDFLPPTGLLILELSAFMMWVLLMGTFLIFNRFAAVAWLLLGVGVVLGLGYHARSFDVEKERKKTKRM